jgi:hypothetical protein
MMRVLLALGLLVHGSIHIGFACSRSWPFAASDPWIVTRLGAPADAVAQLGIALALVTFFAFLFAAGSTIGLLPRRWWRWLAGAGAVASAVMLIAFGTPWTLPGIAVDAALLWAIVVQAWTPAALRSRTA